MAIENGVCVYEKTDPLRHVGTLIAKKGKKGHVQWHVSYSSWVLLESLMTAPEGKEQGDKLGPQT